MLCNRYIRLKNKLRFTFDRLQYPHEPILPQGYPKRLASASSTTRGPTRTSQNQTVISKLSQQSPQCRVTRSHEMVTSECEERVVGQSKEGRVRR
jgi:hypothetical protein